MSSISKKFTQAYYTISALGSINKEDIFLISFPKSGNTWVKSILVNILIEAKELKNDYTFKTLDETIPELSRDNLRKKWKYKTLPRFIKSHIAYRKIFFKKNKTLLIIRDPRNVMVSFFYHVHNVYGFNYEADFSSFIRHKKFGLESCILHQISWQNRTSSIIRYEDLKNSGEDILFAALQDVGVFLPKTLLHQAFENSTFENMKKIEQGPKKYENKLKKGYNFVRKGENNQWQEYFTEIDLNYYKFLLEKYKNVYINYYDNKAGQ